MAERNWEHRGDLRLLRRRHEAKDRWAAFDALLYCRAEKKPLPAWAVDSVLGDLQLQRWEEEHPKTKRGLLAERRREHDHACYQLVELHRDEYSLDEAYGVIGDQLGMTADRVRHAWVRTRKRLKANPIPRLRRIPIDGKWHWQSL